MSRLKNFSRNLTTSYLQLGVNVAYSLVSIPLILHWLPQAEFGIWALLVQMMGYMSLIDLGMTGAVARLLVDHKDERSNGNYGSLIKTAYLVSFVQGLMVLVIVILGAPWLASLMKIPAEYTSTFVLLMRIQGLIMAFNFSMRPLNMMLYAHQRMDLQAYIDIFTLLASLGLLVAFLMQGCGIYSFIYANAITALISPLYMYWNCRRLGVMPQAGEWGPLSKSVFQDVFNYGTHIFLFSLGAQLQMASQTIVVSRFLGLEQAAIWAVGTKMFNLVVPLMCRPNGAALPGLYEMEARGEFERMKHRFQGVVSLTASLGAFLGVSYMLCNSLFVGIWTSGKIAWPAWNDLLLGSWLFLLSMQTTHCCFVNVTKRIGWMHVILFAEGCSFILLAAFVGCQWGIPGMVASSIVCTLLFSYQYSLRRSAAYFQCRVAELVVGWVRPGLNFALVYAGLALTVWLASGGLPGFWRLIIHAMVVCIFGGYFFLRLGLSPEMLREISLRLPSPISGWLQGFVNSIYARK